MSELPAALFRRHARAEEKLQQQRAEIAQQERENIRQLWLLRIYQKARDARGRILKQCDANESVLREYLGLSVDLAVEAVQRNPGQFVWTDFPASKADPKVLEKDRETLAQAAQANRNFSGSAESNLSLARTVLGPGFSQHDLIQAFVSRRLQLTAPTEQERQQWSEEDADKETRRLLNADVTTLKQEVRDGYADRVAQTQAAEAARVLEAKKEFQQGQYKPLPRTWNGQRLDAMFIRAASPQQIRKWKELFGSLQLDLRLRGEN